MFTRKYILSLLLIITFFPTYGQTKKAVPISYGNMNHWIKREVKESYLIGGATKTLYEIAPSYIHVKPNTAYKNTVSPWATSSVYAHVHGISKGSVTVFPEKRDTGYAARLETKVEHVKVLGVIHINVLASGTIFLGQMVEPITNTDNPQSKLITGIPFSKKPHYLQFDYKVQTGGKSKKINGFTNGSYTGDIDYAEAFIMLQQRWETADGKVHAKRIGTGWVTFKKTQLTWQNDYRIKIHYGNISSQSFYKKNMGLRSGKKAYYTRNSKGKIVPIIEDSWGNKKDAVTHLILQFSSSDGGPYIGHPGNKLWIDNVGLIY